MATFCLHAQYSLFVHCKRVIQLRSWVDKARFWAAYGLNTARDTWLMIPMELTKRYIRHDKLRMEGRTILTDNMRGSGQECRSAIGHFALGFHSETCGKTADTGEGSGASYLQIRVEAPLQKPETIKSVHRGCLVAVGRKTEVVVRM